MKGGGDHLYRNDNGHFTEVTKAAGIHGSLISFGLGVSVGDINGDGWPVCLFPMIHMKETICILPEGWNF
ncbi:MAG: VCBS repeat-containing protein [Puia sp.]